MLLSRAILKKCLKIFFLRASTFSHLFKTMNNELGNYAKRLAILWFVYISLQGVMWDCKG